MKQVWKFQLNNGFCNEFHIPEGSKPLCAQIQGGIPCVWLEVDPRKRNELRSVYVVGTGQAIPRDSEYIGTIQQPPLVWHIYIETAQ